MSDLTIKPPALREVRAPDGTCLVTIDSETYETTIHDRLRVDEAARIFWDSVIQMGRDIAGLPDRRPDGPEGAQ